MPQYVTIFDTYITFWIFWRRQIQHVFSPEPLKALSQLKQLSLIPRYIYLVDQVIPIITSIIFL